MTSVKWMLLRVPEYFPGEGDDAVGKDIRVPGETGSSIASPDKRVFAMVENASESSAQALAGALHYFGLSVLVFTVDFGDPQGPGCPGLTEWLFLFGAGVDGMCVGDIPMGLLMESQ